MIFFFFQIFVLFTIVLLVIQHVLCLPSQGQGGLNGVKIPARPASENNNPVQPPPGSHYIS